MTNEEIVSYLEEIKRQIKQARNVSPKHLEDLRWKLSCPEKSINELIEKFSKSKPKFKVGDIVGSLFCTVVKITGYRDDLYDTINLNNNGIAHYTEQQLCTLTELDDRLREFNK